MAGFIWFSRVFSLIMNRKSSVLLDLCSAFAVLAALQVWIAPLGSDFTNSDWSIAWCDNTSSTGSWMLLEIWSFSGLMVAFSFMRFGTQIAYRWTLVSYALFWAFAVIEDRSTAADNNFPFVIVFFVIMLWRYNSFTNDQTPRSSMTTKCQIAK